jgi:hypothetical protein
MKLKPGALADPCKESSRRVFSFGVELRGNVFHGVTRKRCTPGFGSLPKNYGAPTYLRRRQPAFVNFFVDRGFAQAVVSGESSNIYTELIMHGSSSLGSVAKA